MNHPEAMNAASVSMVYGLIEALGHIESDGSARAIVLTGEGKGFCSGANLSEQSSTSAAGTNPVGHSLETAYHPFLRRLRDLNVPLVTAVNGAAAGVGMSIALMGDMIVAARSAYFLQAFARIGLVPDGGSTWLLPRLIGLARAKELSLMAERLPAEKGPRMGPHQPRQRRCRPDGRCPRARPPARRRPHLARHDPPALLAVAA